MAKGFPIRFLGLVPLRVGLIVLPLSVLSAIAIGHRGIDVGTDTWNYVQYYSVVSHCLCFDGRYGPGFQVIAIAVALATGSAATFLTVVSLVTFAASAFVGERVGQVLAIPKEESWRVQFVVLMFLCASPFFVAAHINTMRQGLASLVLFLAFFELYARRLLSAALYSLMAIAVHYSAIMFVLLLPLAVLPWWVPLGLTLTFLLLYVRGLSEPLVLALSNATGTGLYEIVTSFEQGAEYNAGVRLDLVAFSLTIGIALWLCAAFLVERQKRAPLLYLVRVYWILLVPFFILGFANFANRYAYTAWLFASVALGACVSALPSRQLSAGVKGLGLVVAFAACVVMARFGIQR